MFKVLILVCAASTPQAQCKPSTAIDVIQGPRAASVMECGMLSQAFVAETTLAPVKEKTYIKVRCTPVDRSKEV